jgi:hypothetical protein
MNRPLQIPLSKPTLLPLIPNSQIIIIEGKLNWSQIKQSYTPIKETPFAHYILFTIVAFSLNIYKYIVKFKKNLPLVGSSKAFKEGAAQVKAFCVMPWCETTILF